MRRGRLRLPVCRDLHHELLPLLRQVGPLVADHLGHQLLLEAQKSHREVDHRDLLGIAHLRYNKRYTYT